MTNSPIILFTYNRYDELVDCISALQKNVHAADTELFLFSDGPKTEGESAVVQKIRNFANDITGFKHVHLKYSVRNKGLAASVIGGVSEVLKKHPAAIVLEDDLATSKNFLSYMNQSLDFYKDDHQVVSVSGYTNTLNVPSDYQFDNFFVKRLSSWGWATWANRWEKIDWDVTDFEDFSKDVKKQKAFNKLGSDVTKSLKAQMDGKISSWAIRFCYHQHKYNLSTVYPVVSKIVNNGFSSSGTHTTNVGSRFDTVLDTSNKHQFNFTKNDKDSKILAKQVLNKYSLITRILYKVKNSITL